MAAEVRYKVDDEIAEWLERRGREQRMTPNGFARHQLVRVFLADNAKEKEKLVKRS